LFDTIQVDILSFKYRTAMQPLESKASEYRLLMAVIGIIKLNLRKIGSIN